MSNAHEVSTTCRTRWRTTCSGLAFELLRPGGLLGCTNIASANTWRPVMELLADWTLTERNASDMARLLSAFGAATRIDLDPTRLTWLALGVRG